MMNQMTNDLSKMVKVINLDSNPSLCGQSLFFSPYLEVGRCLQAGDLVSKYADHPWHVNECDEQH